MYCVQRAWDETGVCVCVRENVCPLALPENVFGEMKEETDSFWYDLK